MESTLTSPESVSVILSDRRFSIGGDGIILILPSTKADARMQMFNRDGSEGRMCGNGIRCVAKYLYEHNIVHKNKMNIETASGIRKLHIYEQNGKVSSVTVNTGPAILEPKKIPVALGGSSIVGKKVFIGKNEYAITCVSVGNPHCVVFMDNVDILNIEKIGPEFETNSLFPEHVNTEFIQLINRTTLKMRVWERGSGETFACGTGACAAVVAAALNGYCPKNRDVNVLLKGGIVTIKYTDEAVYLTGDAKLVFEGDVEL